MIRRAHRTGTVVATLALAALALACTDAPVPTQSAPEATLAKKDADAKHTFTGVTLVDGDRVVENAVIEAAVDDHKKDAKDFTRCSYFTEDWRAFLGGYGEAVVPGDGSAEAVRDYCVESFPLRD